ncbi:hypothetical protein FQR65_LT18864 [Abscondita terminalis]|nr:hypothetical protein FQR65_LT18864 [Abscondita terminalis]
MVTTVEDIGDKRSMKCKGFTISDKADDDFQMNQPGQQCYQIPTQQSIFVESSVLLLKGFTTSVTTRII